MAVLRKIGTGTQVCLISSRVPIRVRAGIQLARESKFSSLKLSQQSVPANKRQNERRLCRNRRYPHKCLENALTPSSFTAASTTF